MFPFHLHRLFARRDEPGQTKINRRSFGRHKASVFPSAFLADMDAPTHVKEMDILVAHSSTAASTNGTGPGACRTLKTFMLRDTPERREREKMTRASSGGKLGG